MVASDGVGSYGVEWKQLVDHLFDCQAAMPRLRDSCAHRLAVAGLEPRPPG